MMARVPTLVAAALVLTAGSAAAQVRTAVRASPLDSGISLLDKPVDLMLRDASLHTALSELARASGVPVAYSPSLVMAEERRVACDCEATTVRLALEQLLAETRFRYQELRGEVVVFRHNKPSSDNGIRLALALPIDFDHRPLRAVRSAVSPGRIVSARLQQGVVTGVVVDAQTNRPVTGVQVSLPGTGRGGVTNQQGRYLIANVPIGTVVVRVEMLGYARMEQTVTIDEGATVVMNFELERQALDLDAIVVTGTAGQARRREVGNTIAQIDVAMISDAVSSVDDVLQSRALGVNVNAGTSRLGAGAKITLRGNVSVSQGNQPLVFVDGVRQSSATYPQNQSQGRAAATSNEGSPLNDINPADIDRIEIVKGAAAATLYGTEAAAGVIQIFTKKGASGRPSWTYQMEQSLAWTQKYGSNQRPYNDMEQWLRNAHGQNHYLSVSGGAESVRYYVSAGFRDRDGTLPPDEEQVGNLRANLTFEPRQNLTVGWTSFFSRQNLDYGPVGGGESLTFNQLRAPNNFFGSGEREDMESLLDLVYLTTNDRVNLGLVTTWTPFSSVSNRLTVGYDRAASHHQQIRPFGFVLETRGSISDIQWVSETVTLDYVGSFQTALSRDVSTTLSAGAQFIRTSEAKVDAYGLGLPGPGEHTISSTAERNVWQDEMHVNTGGFFVQALAGFRDRYFLTGGLRVDGNSAFGSDFGWQPYPKVSASYVISDEPFWREGWGNLKLRGAYGLAGRAPGAFDAVRTWAPRSFVGQTAFEPLNVGNPLLGPEKTAELEVGFDGTVAGGRIQYEATYYSQRTTDALFPVQQAPSSGFTGSQLENVGEITNRGVELSLDATVLQRQNLEWSIGSRLSTNHSEVISTGTSTNYRLVVGHPAPVVRGTRVVNANEFADPILERDAFFGPNLPTHTIDVHTRLQLPYGIALSSRGQYQGGHYMWIFPSQLIAQRGPIGPPECDDVYAHVPWSEYDGPFKTRNTHPNLHLITARDRALCYKDATEALWTFPANFFKLRTITLEAPLPFSLPNVSNVRLAASLGNIWRWTNKEFKAYDPETISNRNQISSLLNHLSEQTPPATTFTFSLRASF